MPTKNPASKPLQAQVADLRDRIAKTKAELREIEVAPPTQAEAIARAERYIEAKAARAREALPAREFTTPEPCQPARLSPLDGFGKPDVEALLCLVAGDAVKAALADQIKTKYGGEKGIGSETRKRRLDELQANLLALERQEEALIEQAESEGLQIARRVDADPRAVLGLDQPPPKPTPPDRDPVVRHSTSEWARRQLRPTVRP